MATSPRPFPREKQRILCDLDLGGEEHSGIVIDYSASGMFVQTTAAAAPGQEVRVALRPQGQEPIDLVATVVRHVKSHRSIAAVQHAGIGLRILSAPENYFTRLDPDAEAS